MFYESLLTLVIGAPQNKLGVPSIFSTLGLNWESHGYFRLCNANLKKQNELDILATPGQFTLI